MTADDRPRAILDTVARRLAPDLLAEAVEASRRQAVATMREWLSEALLQEMVGLVAEREIPANPAPADDLPANGWYLYGITWPAAGRALDMVDGVAGAGVKVIDVDQVAALVSPLSTPQPWGLTDTGALDLDALAPRAAEHERVLEELLDHGPVIPLRFGVVYPSLDPVENILRQQAEDIASELARLEGHAEWGLTVDWPGTAGAAHHSRSTVPTGPRPGGRDYLARRHRERKANEAGAAEAEAAATGIHDVLASLSSETVIHPVHHSRRGQRAVVLSASYLVPDRASEAFRRAASEALAQASAHLDLRGELTGPWPAYSFVDLQLDGGRG